MIAVAGTASSLIVSADCSIGSGGFALQVKRQEPLEDFLVCDVARPAVGVQHRLVKLLVGELEPGGALVVEVGEGALLEFGGAGAGRVEPGVALLDELAGGPGDGLDARVGGWLGPGRPGEREGLEGGRRGVAEA